MVINPEVHNWPLSDYEMFSPKRGIYTMHPLSQSMEIIVEEDVEGIEELEIVDGCKETVSSGYNRPAVHMNSWWS